MKCMYLKTFKLTVKKLLETLNLIKSNVVKCIFLRREKMPKNNLDLKQYCHKMTSGSEFAMHITKYEPSMKHSLLKVQ